MTALFLVQEFGPPSCAVSRTSSLVFPCVYVRKEKETAGAETW